jgi:hypothetical protein
MKAAQFFRMALSRVSAPGLVLALVATLVVSIVSPKVAHADIYIEPFVGYAMIDYDGEDGGGSAYGGRIGWSALGFAVGAQYTGFASTVEASDETGTKKDFDFVGSNIGVFASFEFPILIRVWATYHLSAEGKVKDFSVDPDGAGGAAAVVGDVSYKGAGTEIGIGFTGLPFLDINLSVTNLTYDDNEHPVQSSAPALEVEETDSTIYMLSVSLPLSL